ncbi:hypothetical protein [Marixanthomonas spongiae]|uniref:Uncharacterized protein n=1 Tax=Marixanthomonas spongiae TaxID=2174845 RepID=A0A2U0I3Y1_9FLAO|nr:hypothetical protein [Marixanthomonas spongiae]PVW15799.1 hypothetical protein DDV96_05900 [Marixanthomonas spongiae]
MKKLVFILLLFPVFGIGQRDFDTRYISIEATPSVEIKGLELMPYKVFGERHQFGALPAYLPNLAPVAVSGKDYWQPVDMFSAATKNNNFIDAKATGDNPFAARLNNQFAQPGLNGNNRFKVYADDEYSRVNNSVYENQTMPYFGNPYYRGSQYGNPYYYTPYYRQSGINLYKNKENKSSIQIQVREY